MDEPEGTQLDVGPRRLLPWLVVIVALALAAGSVGLSVALDQRSQRAEDRLAAIEALSLESLRSTLSERDDEISSELSSMARDLDSLRGQVDSSDAALVDTILKTVRILDRRLDGVEQQSSALSGPFGLEGRVSNLERCLDSLQFALDFGQAWFGC